MIKIKRKFLVLPVLMLIVAGALIWMRSHVLDNLGIRLHERIQSLNLSGFNVRYDSISVNWRTKAIEIDNLVLEKNAYDTTCIYPEFISIEKIHAEGIGLFQLVFRKVLSLETLRLYGPRIVMRRNSLLKLDSSAQKKNEFIMRVDQVFVTAADLMYTDSARCNMITGFKSNLSLTGLALEFKTDKPFAYNAEVMTFDSVEVKMPADFYTFRVRQAKMDFGHHGFTADSVEIIPDVGRIEFGKKHGFEIDRLEGLIPFMKADDLAFSFVDTAFVNAGIMEVQFYLKVFRDKRLPFLDKKKTLPVAMLRNLPFDLVIDSLKVTKSYVQYDEYAEGASEAGRIFFDNLYAVFNNVSNVSTTGNTRLAAHASLLGHGDLDMFVTFPLEANKPSRLSGAIKNFSIPEINSMLTPNTQIKIESGEMKELAFQFTFDNVRSDGEIELNYENLKLITYKDEEKTTGDEREKDNLKTFIMNAFVFRKNMNEDVPQEKRKGTIMYLRDDSRSIFNFWSKSLISGIKSAYNLDKAEAKKSERDSRKEERLSKR